MLGLAARRELAAHSPEQFRVSVAALALPLLPAAVLWTLSASGYYDEQEALSAVQYCAAVANSTECATNQVRPWGWFTDCNLPGTAADGDVSLSPFSYTSAQQVFSCRLCPVTASCVDSEPSDTYLRFKQLTFYCAFSYLLCLFACVRAARAPPLAARADGCRRSSARSSVPLGWWSCAVSAGGRFAG